MPTSKLVNNKACFGPVKITGDPPQLKILRHNNRK